MKGWRTEIKRRLQIVGNSPNFSAVQRRKRPQLLQLNLKVAPWIVLQRVFSRLYTNRPNWTMALIARCNWIPVL